MSDIALATIVDVTNRIEGEVTDQMLVMIEAKIDDASDLAHHYGSEAWLIDTAPPRVKRIVAIAVARFMANPTGLSQSRAADETLAWQDSIAELHFTDIEIEQIGQLGKPVLPRMGTIQMTAYQTHYYPYDRVPVEGGGKPFPYLTPDESNEVNWNVDSA